jgi:hypothetical protein
MAKKPAEPKDEGYKLPLGPARPAYGSMLKKPAQPKEKRR